GHIEVSAEEKNNQIFVYVKDTGVGIPPDIIDKILGVGSAITTEGTNKEKGTGLGLQLCREFVEKNDGTLMIESELNKGTCFYFNLPKAE
ncbi:ATP-binding protein, partial [Candidatus Kapabacteria bacterium]|nr:ATP-binding protein [Candidatus Kapabacteria bacterium]